MWCQRKMVASMESKETYYILHISYTSSEISIDLSCIRPYFVWWFLLHHCTTSVRDLPTSILMLAAISLLTFHKSIILAPLWFYVLRANQISFQILFYPPSTLSWWLFLHGKSCLTTERLSAAVSKKEMCKYWKLN